MLPSFTVTIHDQSFISCYALLVCVAYIVQYHIPASLWRLQQGGCPYQGRLQCLEEKNILPTWYILILKLCTLTNLILAIHIVYIFIIINIQY